MLFGRRADQARQHRLELLPLIARVHAQVSDLQEEIAVHRLAGTFELLHETREPAFVIARLFGETLGFDQHLSERATVKRVSHRSTSCRALTKALPANN